MVNHSALHTDTPHSLNENENRSPQPEERYHPNQRRSHAVPVCPHCGHVLRQPNNGYREGPGKTKGQLAYEFRQAGLSYGAIAKQLGYTRRGCQGSARSLAMMYASRTGQPWPPEEV